MTCKMCLERGKNWKGGDPKCYFDGNPEDNWHCATLDAIRDLCSPFKDKLPEGIQVQFCDDEWYSTIKIDNLFIDGPYIGLCLYLSWYKSRGRTDQIYIMGDTPRKPTEEELLRIINYYKRG